MGTKIAHISDIHFRSLKRHDEYKIVFEKLFSKLSNENVDLIFIGGDIVHSKTQGITPEIIDLLNWWFTNLASIAPTHVILGNHDGLILNKDSEMRIFTSPQTVSLTVVGGAEYISSIKPSELEVSVDFNNWRKDKQFYEIRVKAPNDVIDWMDLSPMSIELIVSQKNN